VIPGDRRVLHKGRKNTKKREELSYELKKCLKSTSQTLPAIIVISSSKVKKPAITAVNG